MTPAQAKSEFKAYLAAFDFLAATANQVKITNKVTVAQMDENYLPQYLNEGK